MNITYFYPWGCFYPVRTGADMVAACHMQYFRSRKIRPRVIVRMDRSSPFLAAFESHYSWVDELCVFGLHDQPDIQRCFDTWKLGTYLAGTAMMCDVPRFRAALSQPADLVFLNYVFSAPLLDAMPSNAVRVLVSNDLISRQFLSVDASPVLSAHHLHLEFELYSLFDAVLMINEDEAELAQRRGAAHAVYIPQATEVLDESEDSEASGSHHYDLLFVGSGHLPNVEGATWFYRHVFEPYLKRRGLRWAIVGSVCHSLEFNDSSVHKLGTVEDLAGMYRRSKVVLIPLFRGAGTSIKTLEAMGRGKAIVATPCGRRGLRECEDCLVELNFEANPQGVAERIQELAGSRPLREVLGRRALAYARTRFGAEAYGRRLDAVLSALLPGRLIAPQATPRAA